MLLDEQLIPKRTFFLAKGASKRIFVAKHGKDSFDAEFGTIDKPYKTIQHALDVSTPGTDVIVFPGVYFEKFQFNVSGNLTEGFIRLYPMVPRTVIFDGSRTNDDKSMCAMYQKNYIVVRGFIFRNCFGDANDGVGSGIRVDSNGVGIAILDCEFENLAIFKNPKAAINFNTNFPIITFIGTDEANSINNVLVDGNYIHNCRMGYSEGISMSGNVENGMISNNFIEDNSNIGIDVIGNYGRVADPAKDKVRNVVITGNTCRRNISPVASSAGIYVDGAEHITIENNVLDSNLVGIEVGCEKDGITKSISVLNNVITNSVREGIGIGGYNPATTGKSLNVLVYGNILKNNDTSNGRYGELLLYELESVGVYNNIFILRQNSNLISSPDGREQVNLDFDKNIVRSPLDFDYIKGIVKGVDVVGYDNITTANGELLYSQKFDENMLKNEQAKKIVNI